MTLLAQLGSLGGLGQTLIWLIVLVALWAIFMAVVAPRLPPPAVVVANIVLGAICAIIAVRILLSFA
jgi:hypothetical protein